MFDSNNDGVVDAKEFVVVIRFICCAVCGFKRCCQTVAWIGSAAAYKQRTTTDARFHGTVLSLVFLDALMLCSVRVVQVVDSDGDGFIVPPELFRFYAVRKCTLFVSA